MPGGWSDPKRTFRVKADPKNPGQRIYVRAYTKQEVISILQQEGIYQKWSRAHRMKEPDEIMEEVHGKNDPIILDDTFTNEPKKTFLINVKPEDIKQMEQREVYVRTKNKERATYEVLSGFNGKGGIQALLVIPELSVKQVKEEDLPIILEDPNSGTDPTKK